MTKSKSAGGGNSKTGRNRAWCLHYRNVGRREVNKLAKVRRHSLRFPADLQARQWLDAA